MKQSDSDDRSLLSRKALARELRRQAYQRAKAQRATDPRLLAMKEAAKERRRELNRQAKERRKASAAVAKSEARAAARTKTAEKRAAADTALMQLITCTAKGSSALN